MVIFTGGSVCSSLTSLQPGAEAGGEVLQGQVHLGGAAQTQQPGQKGGQRLDEQLGALLIRLLVPEQFEGQRGGAQGAVAGAVPRRLLLLVGQRHVVGTDVGHVGPAGVFLSSHGVLIARVELGPGQVLLLHAGGGRRWMNLGIFSKFRTLLLQFLVFIHF